MAATDHTRLRTSDTTVRNESTDKRRIAALGDGPAVGPTIGAYGFAPTSTAALRTSVTPGVAGRPTGTRRKTDEDRAVARAFGATLREARHARGMSQEELAAAAGVDRTYPSLLETGKRQPALSVVYRLCNALRCAPAELHARTLARLRPLFQVEEWILSLPELTLTPPAATSPPPNGLMPRAYKGRRLLPAR